MVCPPGCVGGPGAALLWAGGAACINPAVPLVMALCAANMG